MEHQYVDMYLRKKKGMVGGGVPAAVDPSFQQFQQQGPTAQQQSNGAAAAASFIHQNMSGGGGFHVDRQVDAVLRSAAGVQQFVDRADEISAQVETFEDKLTNLAKLVKLSQTLQDEKEADLRKQNHELKARLKRQEQVTFRLEKEMEALKASQGQVSASVLSRIEAVEQRTSAIDHALGDFMAAYKDGCKQTAVQQTEIAKSLKELAEAHEATRMSVQFDLQGVKEWATRNLTRLKKHVDLQSSDLTALRDSHIETTTQLQRVQAQTDNEHEKLLALLQQKSREANLLTEIVDKEIQSIHTMTQQHRAGLGNSLHHTAPQSSNPSANKNTNASERTEERATTTSSTTVTGKKRSLFDELAFTSSK